MKSKIEKLLKSIFSIFVLIAIFGGGVVFLMFLIALIIGGETGGNIAVSARNTVMPYFIKSATIAVISGLLSFYISKVHTLSLNEKDDDEELITSEVNNN